jgi:hypothetical protein
MSLSARVVKKNQRFKKEATSKDLPNPVKAAQDVTDLKDKQSRLGLDPLLVLGLLYTKCSGGKCTGSKTDSTNWCYGCMRENRYTVMMLDQPFMDRPIHPTILYNDIFGKTKSYRPILVSEQCSFMMAIWEAAEKIMNPESFVTENKEWIETMHEKRVQAQKYWEEGRKAHEERMNQLTANGAKYTDVQFINWLEIRVFEASAIFEIVNGSHPGKTWQEIAQKKIDECLSIRLLDWTEDRSPIDNIALRKATAEAWNKTKTEFFQARDDYDAKLAQKEAELNKENVPPPSSEEEEKSAKEEEEEEGVVVV